MKRDINKLLEELQICHEKDIITHFHLIPKELFDFENSYISVGFSKRINNLTKKKLRDYIQKKYKISHIVYSSNMFFMRIYIVD